MHSTPRPASLAADIQRLARASALFRDAKLEGYYDPLSQAVTVLSATGTRLDEWRRSSNFVSAAAPFLTTAAHELTHWLDHVATLWGQRLLVDIHNAFIAWRLDDPTEFWRVARVAREINAGNRIDYFTTKDQPDGPLGSATTWRLDITSGLGFDHAGYLSEDMSIVFVNVRDRDGARVGRVPLTELALLEASAMWAEFRMRRVVLAAAPEDARFVEERQLGKLVLEELYHPELLLYAAGVQLVAQFQNQGHADIALELTAALSVLTLNLPHAMIQSLRVPDEHRARWGDRASRLLANADRGYAFLLLASSAPSYRRGDSVHEWLEETLRTVGLPELEEVRRAARGEMDALPAAVLANGQRIQERGHRLLEIGRRNFDRRGVAGSRPLDDFDSADAFALPPIVLFDEALAPFGPSIIDDPMLQPEVGVPFASKYRDWAAGFLRACAVSPV